MKIKALVESKSDIGSYVYRTEPPLTEAILDYLFEHDWDESRRSMFSTKNGHFVVTGLNLTPERLVQIEDAFTRVEIILNSQKAETENARKIDLQSGADQSGLPLE